MNPTPSIGHNTKGIATITNEGSRPVVIEYVDEAVGFYYVRDLETNKPYTIFRTSFMPSTSIPPKHRKAAFDRVALAWSQALNAHPQPIVIDPSPLATVSFARLLRDGREAKNKYGWVSSLINDEKWKVLANDLTVTERTDGYIGIGLQSAKFPAEGTPVGTPVLADEVAVKWTDPQQLDALCFLLDRKLLFPVPRFVLTDLNDAIITSLESRYEVGFVQHENDKNKWSIV